jgi:hypothetical protein
MERFLQMRFNRWFFRLVFWEELEVRQHSMDMAFPLIFACRHFVNTPRQYPVR